MRSASRTGSAVHAPSDLIANQWGAILRTLSPSCPGLSRASTSLLVARRAWMAGTSPAMTIKCLPGDGENRTRSASRTGSGTRVFGSHCASVEEAKRQVASLAVMPGRGDEALLRADVPGIHVLACCAKSVDGRDKRGHDDRLAMHLHPPHPIPCRADARSRFRSRGACQGRRERRENRREQETPAESDLTIKGKAYIAGIYEHPTRHAPDKSTAQLHAEVAKGALEDAGPDQGRYRRLFLRRRRAGRRDGRWSIISASRCAISIPPKPAAAPI